MPSREEIENKIKQDILEALSKHNNRLKAEDILVNIDKNSNDEKIEFHVNIKDAKGISGHIWEKNGLPLIYENNSYNNLETFVDIANKRIQELGVEGRSQIIPEVSPNSQMLKPKDFSNHIQQLNRSKSFLIAPLWDTYDKLSLVTEQLKTARETDLRSTLERDQILYQNMLDQQHKLLFNHEQFESKKFSSFIDVNPNKITNLIDQGSGQTIGSMPGVDGQEIAKVSFKNNVLSALPKFSKLEEANLVLDILDNKGQPVKDGTVGFNMINFAENGTVKDLLIPGPLFVEKDGKEIYVSDQKLASMTPAQIQEEYGSGAMYIKPEGKKYTLQMTPSIYAEAKSQIAQNRQAFIQQNLSYHINTQPAWIQPYPQGWQYSAAQPLLRNNSYSPAPPPVIYVHVSSVYPQTIVIRTDEKGRIFINDQEIKIQHGVNNVLINDNAGKAFDSINPQNHILRHPQQFYQQGYQSDNKTQQNAVNGAANPPFIQQTQGSPVDKLPQARIIESKNQSTSLDYSDPSPVVHTGQKTPIHSKPRHEHKYPTNPSYEVSEAFNKLRRTTSNLHIWHNSYIRCENNALKNLKHNKDDTETYKESLSHNYAWMKNCQEEHKATLLEVKKFMKEYPDFLAEYPDYEKQLSHLRKVAEKLLAENEKIEQQVQKLEKKLNIDIIGPNSTAEGRKQTIDRFREEVLPKWNTQINNPDKSSEGNEQTTLPKKKSIFDRLKEKFSRQSELHPVKLASLVISEVIIPEAPMKEVVPETGKASDKKQDEKNEGTHLVNDSKMEIGKHTPPNKSLPKTPTELEQENQKNTESDNLTISPNESKSNNSIQASSNDVNTPPDDERDSRKTKVKKDDLSSVTKRSDSDKVVEYVQQISEVKKRRHITPTTTPNIKNHKVTKGVNSGSGSESDRGIGE